MLFMRKPTKKENVEVNVNKILMKTKYIKIKENRQKYKDRSTGIFTLNSCCTHTKHTQKQAQLIIVVATTKC